MGARVPARIVAMWLAVVAGCDRPPLEPPGPAPPPPVPVDPTPAVPVDPPAARGAPPTSPRFVTPANPDLDPLPPTITRATGKPARRDLGGGWTMTLGPAEIAAAPGDEVEFTIEFRNRKPGSGRPELHPSSGLRFPEIEQSDQNNPAEWLPLQGGRTRGVLLASPADWSHRARVLYIDFRQRQRPGSLGHATTDGPRLTLDTASIVPVQLRRIHTRCNLPDGLAVTVEGRQITAYFAKAMDSGDEIRPRGEFVVRRISGRLTLVGFVDISYSDFVGLRPADSGCPELQIHDNPFTHGRTMHAVQAQFTAPEPGPIDIVIFASGIGGDPRHVTAVRVD